MNQENQYKLRLRRRRSELPDSPYIGYLSGIESPDLDSRILIEIPAYCDPDLLPTMHAAASQAANPERIHFAVCYQGDDDAEFGGVSAFPRTRTVRYAKKDAPGLCAARYACHGLRDGEEFVMHVDSHMRFATGWDVALIEQWRMAGTGKRVLSEYCMDCSGMIGLPLSDPSFDAHAQTRAANVNASYFDKGRVKLRFTARSYIPGPAPARGMFIGGHFVFGPSAVDDDVPSDPDMFFTADEVCIAARLYTHGYDVYHPGVRCVYHVFHRSSAYAAKGAKALRFTSDDGTASISDRQAKERPRMEQLLGHSDHGIDFGIFGHGSERSMDDFMRDSCVDFRTLSFTRRAYCEAYSLPRTDRSDEPACVDGKNVVPDAAPAADACFDIPVRTMSAFRLAAASRGMPYGAALEQAVAEYMEGGLS